MNVTIRKNSQGAYRVSTPVHPYLAGAWTIKDCRRHIVHYQSLGILPQGVTVRVIR